MKRKGISAPVVFFLALAIFLFCYGVLMSFGVFRENESILLNHQNHEQLMEAIRFAAVKLMAGAGMVVAGLGILLIVVLHLLRRTVRIQKEADALRRKNDQMREWNEQTQQLAHHQRLETIGTLTSSIAHEFNNLLTPIMGYSLMSLEQLGPDGEELYDNLLEIYNASREAKTIISRLSDLSRKNSDLTMRLVSSDEILHKTMTVANPAKPRKVEVKLDLNCQDQRIRANELQLSQLLLNLVINSFHAMEQTGGTLTLTTSFDEKYVHILVSDTGCGIPEDIQDRVFDPFFTTKESGKGTGLGLAIAAQVVEDHKGRITLTSREGEGTSVRVSLPRPSGLDAQG